MKTNLSSIKIYFFVLMIFIIPIKLHAQQFTKAVKEYITVDTPVVALVDAKIIDGTGNPSKTHQTIIIDNGIIEKTGNTNEVDIPKNAEVINCTGKTIIPGMVMMHEHFFYTVAIPGHFFNVAESA